MNKRMATGFVAVMGAALVALVACDPGPEAIATAKPAANAKLVEFSKNVTKKVSLGRDAEVVQYFCHTTTGDACPKDIATKLAAYGFKSESNGVDLAYVFTAMAADAKDGNPDKSSSDDDFIAAAYRVVLGRAPDDGGAKTNLDLIKNTGQRKTVLRSMLQSPEFQQPREIAMTAPPAPVAVPAPSSPAPAAPTAASAAPADRVAPALVSKPAPTPAPSLNGPGPVQLTPPKPAPTR